MSRASIIAAVGRSFVNRPNATSRLNALHASLDISARRADRDAVEAEIEDFLSTQVEGGVGHAGVPRQRDPREDGQA